MTKEKQSPFGFQAQSQDNPSEPEVVAGKQQQEEELPMNTTTDGSTFLNTFVSEFEEKQKKKTVEETHTRQTYLIDNDLIKRLNKLATKKGKGFKTALINRALATALDELEQLKK